MDTGKLNLGNLIVSPLHFKASSKLFSSSNEINFALSVIIPLPIFISHFWHNCSFSLPSNDLIYSSLFLIYSSFSRKIFWIAVCSRCKHFSNSNILLPRLAILLSYTVSCFLHCLLQLTSNCFNLETSSSKCVTLFDLLIFKNLKQEKKHLRKAESKVKINYWMVLKSLSNHLKQYYWKAMLLKQ